MKMPNFKNMTRRALVITVSIVLIATILMSLGITAIALSAQRVQFGQPVGQAFRMNNLICIRAHATNERSRRIFADDDWLSTLPSYRHAGNEIMRLLNNGGRTNRLTQMFRNTGEERVTRNTTNNTTLHNIGNNSGHHYLRLTFMTPQWSIVEVDGRLEIAAASANPDRQIHQIFILLNDIPNRFQQQEWFISTATPPTDRVMYRFVTWGNYHRLANFIYNLDLVEEDLLPDLDDSDVGDILS